ncbi:MAG: TetR family transcriptional regulator [Mycobacterium sp.]|uniref:TetR/AcrR family transcriptional regulator n=1 Tax=Mycobacterium sp. TaxID=1785 RepID=UPI003F9B34F0
MTQRRTHTGRRPGPNTTRALIEDTARKLFAELGYERTSLRQVALQAGVDPTLVSHYFGAKRDLFLAVVELPFNLAVVIDVIVADDQATAGRRLAALVLGVLDDEVRRRPLLGIVRAATAEPEAAALVRDFLTRNVITPIAARLGTDDADYRAALVMSQIMGFTLTRYVVGIDALAHRDREAVTVDLGGTLQRYLFGELSP